MAGSNRINNLHDAPVFEYKQLPWGDLIYGTKEQLQGIGIAAGMAFPGEPNGPKRSLRVTDPRGLTAKVETEGHRGEGIFSASIPFTGRDRLEHEHATDFAPGVSKRETSWGDEFIGTAESLSSAGLVRRDQLPGQPGMRKVTVTILADGSLPKGAPTAKCREADEPGAIRISRKSRVLYEVCIRVSKEEEERRRDAHSRAEIEWKNRMMSLPRPAPLCRTSQERKEIQAARTLVASWPESTREFRERTGRSVGVWLDTIERLFDDGKSGGYRFDDGTISRVYELADQLREMAEAGGIVMDMELRKKHTPGCISEEVIAADMDYATKQKNLSIQYGVNVVLFRKKHSFGQRPTL